MSRELYIYWRIDANKLPAALAAAEALQAELRQRFATLNTRLLQRPTTQLQATVMEIYSAPGGIDGECQARIESLGAQMLGPHLSSRVNPDEQATDAQAARHVEVFEPV